MGLNRAGFDVVGVDHRPQPHYPFCFYHADALMPPVDLADFDFIWASPPCQKHSAVTPSGFRKNHVDLIAPTRVLLASTGALTCIENVPNAPLNNPLVLTGTMFSLNTYRRRHFELNFPCFEPLARGKPFGPWSRPGAVGVYGRTGSATTPGGDSRKRVSRGRLSAWRAAMGIDWMSALELAQAIPPAYAEFIGRAALHALRRAA